MDPARARQPASPLERTGEALSLALVCLSPWAFGAVEAWAELALELGIAALALIALIAGWRAGRKAPLLGLPSMALLGLVVLALFQRTPLSDTWLRRLSPAAAAARTELAPANPVRVYADPLGPVAPPAPTLSENPEETLRAALRLTAGWVLFQAVLELGGGVRALRRFGQAVAGNAALLALFSLIQALSWNGKIYWVRPSPMGSGWNTGGPFVGHSPLAAELNLGLGFALAFLLTPSQRRRIRPWAAYLASVIAVGVVASHSRTGFMAMAVTTVVFAAALRSARIRPGAGIWVGLGMMLALIPVLLIAMGRTSTFSRIGTIAETSAYSSRLEIWTRALEAWRQRPLWGSGLGTFLTAASPYFVRDSGLVYTRAENEYLDLLVEGGLIGLALALLFLWSIARSGRVAWRRMEAPRDQFVVLGALFGMLSLAIHSLSDFAVHIPAVGVTAVVLVARVCGLGSGLRRTPQAAPTFAWALAACASLVPIALVLIQGVSLARAEAALAGTGIPMPGSAMPDVQAETAPATALEGRRAALGRALALRPNWAEGHLRLGLTELGLYRAQAGELLGAARKNPEESALLARPIWLHGVVHNPSGPQRLTPRQIADQEPIRRHLVPATRSFLEARRSCPTLALAHAELAQLDYLIENPEPVSVHVARAVRLGRSSADLLELAATAALQADDKAMACRAWHAALQARPEDWRAVADAAGVALGPGTILEQILTPGSGRLVVRFAERLYADPEDEADRTRFLREALIRLPHDTQLPPAERLELEARAFAALDERGPGRQRMIEALRLDPEQSDWRQQLVLWLIEWGDPVEARRQAMVGIHLDPGNSDLRRALEAAAEALAQGDPPPTSTSTSTGRGARPLGSYK